MINKKKKKIKEGIQSGPFIPKGNLCRLNDDNSIRRDQEDSIQEIQISFELSRNFVI